MPPALKLKQLEMHGCVFSIVATDALVLKHQAISIHSVDQISSVLGVVSNQNIHSEQHGETKSHFKMNDPVV